MPTNTASIASSSKQLVDRDASGRRRSRCSNSTPSLLRLSTSARDDLLGQAELRDAVHQHAARLVQRLEDGHLVAVARQVAGGRQPRRAGADDRDPLAGRRGDRGMLDAALPRSQSARKRSMPPDPRTGPCDLPDHADPSHCSSCGQTRPQTAGSALSSLMRARRASGSRPRRPAMKAGMSTPTGQPLHARLGSCTGGSAAPRRAPGRPPSPSGTSPKLPTRSRGSCSALRPSGAGRAACSSGRRGARSAQVDAPGRATEFTSLARSPAALCSRAPASAARHACGRARARARFWNSLRSCPSPGRRSAGGAQLVEVHAVAVELRAVDADELDLAATVTRQPPHIPVPSTMTGLRLTSVWTAKGSVVFETNFIIGGGPIAIARSTSEPAARRRSIAPFRTSVTKPFWP